MGANHTLCFLPGSERRAEKMNLRMLAALVCGCALCGCADISRSTSSAENRLGKEFAGMLSVSPAEVEVSDLVERENRVTFTATTSKGVYNCGAERPSVLSIRSETRNRTCTKIK